MKQQHVPSLIIILSLFCGTFLTSMAMNPAMVIESEVRGTVTEESTGEAIPFANVIAYQEGAVVSGAITDFDGKFTFRLEPGRYRFEVKFLAYETETLEATVEEGKMLELNFELKEDAVTLDEVVILDSEPMIESHTTLSSTMLDADEIRSVASIQSEKSRGGKRSKRADRASSGAVLSAPASAGYVAPAEFSYHLDASSIHVSPDEHNTEEYDHITENAFKEVVPNPVSTFSIDVDAASYANVRRYLDYGNAPPADAVRIEELVNYFTYDYPQPVDEHPFSMNTEISDCPWNDETKLIHIGIQGEEISMEDLDPSNLVFLIDVSGSMSAMNKLPLVKSSLYKLVDQLNPHDRVALVVYAGAAGEVLPSTSGTEKQKIKDAISRLSSGGSTAGGAGIKLAYDIAEKYKIKDGNNRVILCTDGDFNVGMSSDGEMVRLIEEKRKKGVYLTVCGFGMGNYKDSKLEKLADKGNGNYFYIDREQEANKVFVEQMRSTLYTIAKDVKIQIEFNPAKVKSYRLIGYENRMLAKEDFDDDTKDAGELGVGHTVTALYEVQLAQTEEKSNRGDAAGVGSQFQELETEELRYQQHTVKAEAYATDEILTLKFRYKKPDEETSRLIVHPLVDDRVPIGLSSDNFRWSAAVAAWGMILRDSEHKGDADIKMVRRLAEGSTGPDLEGYRKDFLDMIKTSQKILASK